MRQGGSKMSYASEIKNHYMSYPAVITKIERETFDVKTYTVKFVEENIQNSFHYRQGQFAEISLFGYGESPISITSSPSRPTFLEFTIRGCGKVTNAIHQKNVGDILYIRGPYGNSFPFEEIKGKNVAFVAGGIGLAPLRSLINRIFDERGQFGKVSILYGSKTPDELCFKKELEEWKKMKDTEVLLTVDKGDETWKGNVGVVTILFKQTKLLTSENGVAFVCGPPVMIPFCIAELQKLGFTPQNIYSTLERYMKCGIGKCGHCNIGEKFMCMDGPVFAYEEMQTMKMET
jgi:sulfite reductase subunit B